MVETLADQIIGIAENLRFKAENHGGVNASLVSDQMADVILAAMKIKEEADEVDG